MDFGKINTAEDSNLGASYHVVDPYTDEPAYVTIGQEERPVTITVLGPDADKVRKHQTEMLRATMKKQKGLRMDPGELEKKMVTHLATAITGWQGIVMNGEELECTKENAIELLERHTWLREQLAGFQQDRSNFLAR